jgi:hypothetical protein
MKNIKARLQTLERSTPGINSLSDLSDAELKIEVDLIKTRLKRALESGDCSKDEVIEINRVLERA